MISLIVSSKSPELFNNLKLSVEATIGVPYEIVKIDNAGIMGISEAYNNGAHMAKNGYLCFVHEDVIFKTINWGKNLINALDAPGVGLIGIAGGSYKSAIPGPAWHNGERYVNVIYPQYGEAVLWHERGTQPGNLVDVAVVDGVFIGCRKETWEVCKFDDITLKGFHFYDLDISLSVLMKNLRVCVTYDILLHHLSAGSNDLNWYIESGIAHDKWKNYLPVMSQKHTRNEIVDFDYIMAKLYFKNNFDFNAGLKKKLITAAKLLQLKPLNIGLYKILIKSFLLKG